MPFGVVYGALFFATLGLWLATAGTAWAPLPAARLLAAAVALALAVGLVLRRRWARWIGLLAACAVTAVGLFGPWTSAGVAEYAIVFGSLVTAGLLLVPVTGRPAPATDAAPAAPTLGRFAAAVATLGLAGLLLVSWVGTLSGSVPATAADTAAGRDAPLLAGRVLWSDFAGGLERAGETGRPVLVSFVTNWCGYCKKMDRSTWKDPGVIRAVQERLVPVRVVADESREREGYTGEKLAERYGVSGYPTLMLVDARGKVLSRSGGYMTPSELLGWLEGALRRAGAPAAGSNAIRTSKTL